MPYASWLSPRVLLAVGPHPVQGGGLEMKALSLQGELRSDGVTDSGVLILLRFPNVPAREALASQLTILDRRSLFRCRLAALAPKGRRAVLAFLVESLSWDLPAEETAALAASLRHAREALRERLPPVSVETADASRFRAEAVVQVDDRSFYLTGAIEGQRPALQSVIAVSPEGSRTKVANPLFRPGRRTPRFGACFSPAVRSVLPDGWLLEMGAGKAACESPVRIVRDLAASRRLILDHLAQGTLDDRVMADHIFPALSRLQAQRRSAAMVDRAVEFGQPSAPARTSVIVALDQPIATIEHQLAQFAFDPDMQSADLVYVLDAEPPHDRALETAARLYELYRVPFRIVTLTHHAGFAAAVDAGMSLARGRLMAFLGATVLPDRAGWLTALAQFYDSRENIGALGATLLGPNHRVRHAGFNVVRATGPRGWQLKHRSAGRSRPENGGARGARVAAVSANCLMVERSWLERANGISGMFVQRDFEAADLCRRLTEAGRDVWVCPGVELYDLHDARRDRRLGAAQHYDEWVFSRQRRRALPAEPGRRRTDSATSARAAASTRRRGSRGGRP